MSDFVTQPIAAMASGRGSRGGWSRHGRAAAQAGRDALYLTIGMLTSIVAFAVWVTGVTLSVSLAIFIVGLPVILATAVAFRWTADLDRLNAAILRGGLIRARYRDHRGERFFSRLWST